MSNIPADLKYTKDHEWTRIEGDVVTVGITEHAVEQLGDITMVTLPDVGATMSAGDPFGDVDSVKAVSELYAPLTGEVIEVNGELDDAPESVNSEPYGAGWMLKIKVSDTGQFSELLDAEAYGKLVAEAE